MLMMTMMMPQVQVDDNDLDEISGATVSELHVDHFFVLLSEYAY